MRIEIVCCRVFLWVNNDFILSSHLIPLSDQERARLSRTIHDELGQMLTRLKMDLAWIQRRLSPDQDPLLEKTRAMLQLLHAGIQSIRGIASELRPGLLDDFGLEAAVEWYLEEFARRTEIPCTFTSEMEAAKRITNILYTATIRREIRIIRQFTETTLIMHMPTSMSGAPSHSQEQLLPKLLRQYLKLSKRQQVSHLHR